MGCSYCFIFVATLQLKFSDKYIALSLVLLRTLSLNLIMK